MDFKSFAILNQNYQISELDIDIILKSYRHYMKFSTVNPPSRREFVLNMEAKIQDLDFLGDTKAILRPDFQYNPVEAYELVRMRLIDRI